MASATALAVSFGAYAAIARLRWRLDAGSVLIGSLASSYVNAGNLGLAIAAYVVGDITVVVPTLLVQMLVVQPLALAVLDRHVGRGDGAAVAVRRLVTNPLTVAAVVGLVLAVAGVARCPTSSTSRSSVLAGAAIPLMLIVVRRRAPAEPAARTRGSQP